MSETLIYHNPRCSKSRETLALLEDHGVKAQIVQYLETPPNKNELTNILNKLNLTPRELMRKGEAIYKELNLADQTLSESQLIQAMIKNPKLIERPIVLHKNKAMIGRPPESVLALFK